MVEWIKDNRIPRYTVYKRLTLERRINGMKVEDGKDSHVTSSQRRANMAKKISDKRNVFFFLQFHTYTPCDVIFTLWPSSSPLSFPQNAFFFPINPPVATPLNKMASLPVANTNNH